MPDLTGLRTGHPRLLLTPADAARLREAVEADATLRDRVTKLSERAEAMFGLEPVSDPRGPGGSSSILAQSRDAFERISTLGGLYLITGKKRYATRARQELLAVSAFKDWNPASFLDTAEMTAAAALGYDWLFDTLSASERKAVRRDAIIKKGLRPGLAAFLADEPPAWTRVATNWGLVCNSGLTLGALAVAEENSALAGQVLDFSRQRMKAAMRAYSPDGAFPEGPGYWRYATRYTAFHLAALESALGTHDGLTAAAGFDRTGFYRIHVIGPSARSFNYADNSEAVGVAAEMFYLARVFRQPAFAHAETRRADRTPSIFHILWHPGPIDIPPDPLPLDALFRRVEAAFFRSDWSPGGLYVAVKGGDNRFGHAHLDLGSFVIDSEGQRFVLDLGPDDYSLPGYFEKQRWSYYRLRTEAHNTLTLDNANQSTDGRAAAVAFLSNPARAHVVLDLTHGYRTQATRVMRGVALLDRSRVLVQDEIEARRQVQIAWNFLTTADVRVDGRIATLKAGAAAMRVHLIEPAAAAFEVLDVSAQPPPQAENPGVKNLRLVITPRNRSTRFVVLITRGDEKPTGVPVEPLAQWQGALGQSA